MRRRQERLRKLGIGAGIVVVALALLYLGAGLLLRSLLDPATVARWAEPRMERALNRDVEIGAVGLSIFPGLEAQIRELEIESPSEVEAPPLATVRRVRLGVALLPLLRRRVEVEEAVVEGADVQLVVQADGRSNFGDFVPEGPSRSPDGDAPVRVEIREFELEDSRVRYRDLAAERTVDAVGLSGRVGLEEAEEGWSVRAEGRAEGVSATGLPGGRRLQEVPASLRLVGDASSGFRSLRVESGRVEIAELPLAVGGRIDSLRAPVRRVDLRVEGDAVPLERVLALAERVETTGPDAGEHPLREVRGASGSLGLDLQIRGAFGPDRRPRVEGLLTVRDGRYAPEGRAPLAEGLQARILVSEDSLTVADLRGQALGGPLEASGVLALDSLRRFSGRVRAAPALGRWPWSGGADGEPETTLSGRVDADLRVRGRLGVPAATRADGTVELDDVEMTRADRATPVVLPGGSVRMLGDSATTRDLPIALGGDTLRVDATVTRLFSHRAAAGRVPGLAATVRGPRLDLASIFPRDDDSTSYARIAFAHLSGQPVDGRPAASAASAAGLSRPSPLPVTGQVRVRLGELLYGSYRLSEVDARIALRPERLEVREASFGVFGGRARADLGFGLGSRPVQPFSLSLAVDSARGEELIARLTPAGRLLSGTASLEIRVEGGLDTLFLPVPSGLEGTGQLVARDGQLHANPVTAAVARVVSLPALRAPGFSRLAIPFRIRGDSLLLQPGTIRADSVSVRLEGVLGLGGRLDLSAALQLPRSVLGRLPAGAGISGQALQRLIGGRQGPVDIGFRIRGTAADPQVALDLTGLRQEEAAAREQLREGVRETLEERAGGLLDRLMGTRRRGADTVSPDTVRPDTTGGG